MRHPSRHAAFRSHCGAACPAPSSSPCSPACCGASLPAGAEGRSACPSSCLGMIQRCGIEGGPVEEGALGVDKIESAPKLGTEFSPNSTRISYTALSYPSTSVHNQFIRFIAWRGTRKALASTSSGRGGWHACSRLRQDSSHRHSTLMLIASMEVQQQSHARTAAPPPPFAMWCPFDLCTGRHGPCMAPPDPPERSKRAGLPACQTLGSLIAAASQDS